MASPAKPPRLLRLNHRVLLVALHDIVMAALSFLLALWLRFSIVDHRWSLNDWLLDTAGFAAVAAVVFLFAGLYRGIWHFASMRDVIAILRGSALSILIFLAILFLFTRLEDYPRSASVLQFFILVALLTGPRMLYRSWKDGSLVAALQWGDDKRVPVLLLGSGAAADAFIREMQRGSQTPYRVVGILDDSAGRHGRDLRGIRVLGRIDDLAAIVAQMRPVDRPHRIIIADDRFDGRVIGALVDAAGHLGITVARLPRLTEFRKESDGAAQVRPIDVEDLLGRPQRVLDRAAVVRLVGGKRVLVTGAGGTIGSELVRQVAALEPALIVLFEQSEHALYQIDMELAERFPGVARLPVLGDVRSADAVERVFAAHRPEIVLHAAAYKHVPLVEANIGEGILTNVQGTAVVAQASRRHGVGVMVMISTDKAVNPTNVMGASKRVAEMVCQSLDLERASSNAATQYVTVRFGNVLGSSGSVVPLFQRQLGMGGPLTVTHPDVTRFFMTTREAVELILQAAAMSGDAVQAAGKIFVLDMGEPVRIRDLAQQMIRLAGLRPDKDVKIVYTGLRPGEKLYEEVLHSDEATVPTPQDGIMLAAPRIVDRTELERAIAAAAQAAREQDTATLLQLMKALVPEFEHAPNGQAVVAGKASDSKTPVSAA